MAYSTVPVRHRQQPEQPRFACNAIVGMVTEFYENYLIEVGSAPCKHAVKDGLHRYRIPKALVVKQEVDDATVVCLDCFYDRMKSWREECVQ